MAEKLVYVGNRGPYGYDDEDHYADDGDIPVVGLRTDGQLWVETPATLDNHVVRKDDLDTAIGNLVLTPVMTVAVADIDNPASEMASLNGGDNGKLCIAYEVLGNINIYTVYAWDTNVSGGAVSPYVVAGDGGFWVAVAGRYRFSGETIAEYLTLGGALTVNNAQADNDFHVHGEGQQDCLFVDASQSFIEMNGTLKVFGPAQFNPGPTGDNDFRIDGATQTLLFSVDAGLDRVSVGGQATPQGTFSVKGNMAIGATWSSSGSGMTVPESGLAIEGKLSVGGAAEFNALGADRDFRVHGDSKNDVLFVDADQDALHLNINGGSIYTHGFLHINADTGDFDTRIDGDTQTALFFVNAGTDRVSVGGEPDPAATFAVKGSVAIGGTYAGTAGSVTVPSNGMAVQGKIFIGAGTDSQAYNEGIRIGSGDDSDDLGEMGTGIIINAQDNNTDAYLMFQVTSEGAENLCGIRWDDVESGTGKKWALYMDSANTGEIKLDNLAGVHGLGVTWSQLNGFDQRCRSFIVSQKARLSTQPAFKIVSDLTVDSRHEEYHDYAATTNATVTVVRSIATAAGDKLVVEVQVGASDSTGAKYTGRRILGYFANIAGTLSQLGSTYDLHTALESDAAYNVDFNISSQNIQVRVTGKAGDSLVWHIYTDVKEFG